MKSRKHQLLLAFSVFTLTIAGCKKESEINMEAPVRPITANSSPYVTDLFEYLPAPGQAINTTAGSKAGAENILGKRGSAVSLGAWGGTIVLGFDHTVINTPGAPDILILGNAFENFAEPGVIWVMQDDNGNGKPDDTWYEIAGSEYGKEGYVRDYSVTYHRPDPAGDVSWSDNKGNSGVIKSVKTNWQYYPAWITANSYTLTGTLLPKSNITEATFVSSKAFEYGYADNTPGGDRIDLDDAIDKDGKKVSLKGIDFIKVQTGVLYNMGVLGELSTELQGIADLSLVKE
ncbi:cell surface protein [Arcticibacter sp. MXS-1]|uniref:cell surface protein n=1 Tax=Arcticibacter sp. MXS-1 TaxID=3341726 RepID=UPI0035A88149